MKIPHSCPSFDKAIKLIDGAIWEAGQCTISELIARNLEGAKDWIEEARSINSSLRDAWHEAQTERDRANEEIDQLLAKIDELEQELEVFGELGLGG